MGNNIIPCKNCLIYAVCMNKEQVRCFDLKHYIKENLKRRLESDQVYEYGKHRKITYFFISIRSHEDIVVITDHLYNKKTLKDVVNDPL
jgi:hypothetical protein